MKQNKLHNIKGTGFKVPDDYFNTLEDVILSDIKLNKMSKDSGFKLPEDYFNNLEDTIIDKVSTKPPAKVIPLFRKKTIIYLSGIAAAILLLFNLSFPEEKPAFDSLDFETVENYIMNENIGSYEIATLLSEKDLLEEHFIEYKEGDEDTIENYILDNLDIDDIILE
ncbi:hypothetical protein Q4Q34_13210 [Flavivirga abyssicola]|uniref:hypothetical protein n=1 Tax=Flavivirga abyssicola TaxID=3063533 RepID=UPI0026E05FDF|nr:hypothetical protein [Flavivirga sp. MEBiC07777]WVK12178.1 hypothetical protein Q4Q34_13210 [Flavivirga sp. MEBiC07777]